MTMAQLCLHLHFLVKYYAKMHLNVMLATG